MCLVQLKNFSFIKFFGTSSGSSVIDSAFSMQGGDMGFIPGWGAKDPHGGRGQNKIKFFDGITLEIKKERRRERRIKELSCRVTQVTSYLGRKTSLTEEAVKHLGSFMVFCSDLRD